eukprot:TRINITY_DN4310_c0_g2_i1.p1 TRINITY_DN4310_c0_g2~~TRINITY_DN4310_c0_g2_i1.p1  ORF type:complete len:277 (+),score=91.49 TRINITY_DN4310_c0_g2_i1:149-979(+)
MSLRSDSSTKLISEAEIRETERYRIEENWSKTRPLINLVQELLLWEHPSTVRFYVQLSSVMGIMIGMYYYYASTFGTITWLSIIGLCYLFLGPFAKRTFNVAFDRMESEAALRGYHSDDHSLWNVVIKTHLAIKCDLRQNLNALLAFRRANSTKFTFHTTFVLFLLFVLSIQLSLVSSLLFLVFVGLTAPGIIRNNILSKSWSKAKESPFFKTKLEPHLEKAQILIGMKAPPSPPPSVSPPSSLSQSQDVESKETLGTASVVVALKQEGSTNKIQE